MEINIEVYGKKVKFDIGLNGSVGFDKTIPYKDDILSLLSRDLRIEVADISLFK